MNHFVRNAFKCPHYLLRSRTIVVIVLLGQTLNLRLSTGQLLLPFVDINRHQSSQNWCFSYKFIIVTKSVEVTGGVEDLQEGRLGPFSRLVQAMDSCLEILMFWLSVFVNVIEKARRPKESRDESGDKLYLQEALLERKLPELDMRQLVDLPQGLDYNEWLASHTLALFDHVNLLYGTVSEFCTAATCPEMAGPGGRQYQWYDERGKKSRIAAPQYVDYVMTFTQKTVNDETLFPTKYANEFPAQFEGVVRRVLRLLFHVVAHMYAAHFRELALLRLHAHLHLTFAHLTALDQRFSLLEQKETEVLRDLEVALRLTETAGPGGGGVEIGEEQSPRRSPVVTQPLATA